MLPVDAASDNVHSSGENNPSFDAPRPGKPSSISPIFSPTAKLDGGDCLPDMVVLSKDGVHFSVHSHILIATRVFIRSFTDGGTFFAENDNAPPILNIAESSTLINVILHAIYRLDGLQHYHYSVQELVCAIDRMPYHNLVPNQLITPSNPLHSLLEHYALLFPMDIFALAAHHHMDMLAVTASSFLHAFPLMSISDELAERIGPVYLKRLFSLHSNRTQALRSVLLSQPIAAKPCGSLHQSELTRSWALVTAYFAWNPQPSITASAIETAVSSLRTSLRCAKCIQSLDERVKKLLLDWDNVKKTI